jgi:Mlc titration factor MtfA (ptsG expression regulator)
MLLNAVKKLFLQKDKTVTTSIIYDASESALYKPTYLVYKGKNLQLTLQEIEQSLTKYFPYYNNLNEALKVVFKKRLQQFIKNKIFIIHAKEGYKEMPILLSAAAIQITFGLENYMLSYFKYLQIHPEEYFAANSFRVLAGHVQGNSITIAFNQLLKGNQIANDGSNVGLHEMAHALYYQEIIINQTPHDSFDYLFEKVLEEGEEVYAFKHKNTLFSDYAFKELQEFWAESVEIFFEKPQQMQQFFPELFEIICNLLQQNPLMGSSPRTDKNI